MVELSLRPFGVARLGAACPGSAPIRLGDAQIV
jgi:hypothetical protein